MDAFAPAGVTAVARSIDDVQVGSALFRELAALLPAKARRTFWRGFDALLVACKLGLSSTGSIQIAAEWAYGFALEYVPGSHNFWRVYRLEALQ